MSTEADATPKVIIDSAATEQGWALDEARLAKHMSNDYGMSREGIERTIVILSGKNHLSYKGSETPGTLDRRFRGVTDENEGARSVIRITTTLKGIQRSLEDVNETLSHGACRPRRS